MVLAMIYGCVYILSPGISLCRISLSCLAFLLLPDKSTLSGPVLLLLALLRSFVCLDAIFFPVGPLCALSLPVC